MERRRDGKHFPQKFNLIQNSEGNEENGYPVLDLQKTLKNETKESSNTH
jgi:hypothetical protein